MNDVFSVVIPVYNRDNLVQRCLESVYEQTYRPISLIVVDNNSTDNTLDVVKSWKEAHESDDFRITILQESQPGAAAARNKGLDAVESEYMCFFDSDDVMRPKLAETAMEVFMRNPEADILCWQVTYHDFDGTAHGMNFADKDFLQENILRAIMRTLGYAVRASVIREVGGWNPSVMIWNDWELGMRLLTKKDIRIIPKHCVVADAFACGNSITGFRYGDKADAIAHAIQVAEKDLENENDYVKSLVRLVTVRVAGRMRREGYKKEALQLKREALAKAGSERERAILKRVYLHTIFLKRGAAVWAAPLLRKIYP